MDRKPQPMLDGRPLPTYGVEQLYMFPYYANREVYAIMTGEPAPPYNPLKPDKFWFDKSVLNEVFEPGEPKVYERVCYKADGSVKLATNADGSVKLDASGKSIPVFTKLFIDPIDASRVNIPDKRQAAPPGGNHNEVQVPCFDLLPTEHLEFGRSPMTAAILQIRRDDVPFVANQPATNAGGFTVDDRVLLQRIAAKVGA
jgi:hypothetical protein